MVERNLVRIQSFGSVPVSSCDSTFILVINLLFMIMRITIKITSCPIMFSLVVAAGNLHCSFYHVCLGRCRWLFALFS